MGTPWTTASRLPFFRHLTRRGADGRDKPDPAGYQTSWLITGRRGGKSRIMSAVACYLACFRNWQRHLSSGEVAHIVLAARDHRQAQSLKGYIRGMLMESPLLSRFVLGETGEGIQLSGNVQISVQTSDYRSIRGRTIAAALLDEVGFWPSDANSASPDTEIINALKPAMVTMPGSMLIGASTPYARSGVLWQAYDAHYGRDSDELVVQASTRQMNANISESYIAKEIARDPANKSEYLAVWRDDCEAFVSLASVKACVGSYVQRPYNSDYRYVAFLDPSGGRSDAMSLAIGHREFRDGLATMHIDLVAGRKAPFDPTAVAGEFAAIMRSYRISAASGDSYSGDTFKGIFQRYGIAFTPIKKVRSELYRDFLPLINSQTITLPDDPEMIRQIVGLERTIHAGKEKIDHPRNGHDDLANAIAGCAELLVRAGVLPVAAFGVQSSTMPWWEYGRQQQQPYDEPVTIKDGAGNSGTGFATARLDAGSADDWNAADIAPLISYWLGSHPTNVIASSVVQPSNSIVCRSRILRPVHQTDPSPWALFPGTAASRARLIQ